MRERSSSGGHGGLDASTANKQAPGLEEQVRRLHARMRRLEGRLVAYEPLAAVRLDDLLDGPQRRLSPAEIAKETRRLLAVCADEGVSAVLPEVCTCRELLSSLAAACFRSGLTSAGQYLDYLASPFAHD